MSENKSIKTAFICAGIIESEDEKNKKNIILCPVSNGKNSEINKSFSNSIPFAEFSLIVDENTSSYEFFKEGEVYYLTISK